MPAGEFKARCLQLMDEVRRTGVPLTITKRGVPVARLVPMDEPRVGLFDCMKGTADIVGDLLEPAVPETDWEALE